MAKTQSSPVKTKAVQDGDAIHIIFSCTEMMNPKKFKLCAQSILYEAGCHVGGILSDHGRSVTRWAGVAKAKYGMDFLRFLVKAEELIGPYPDSRSMNEMLRLIDASVLVPQVAVLAASYVESIQDLEGLQYFLEGNDLGLFGDQQFGALLDVLYDHLYPKREQVMAWLAARDAEDAAEQAAEEEAKKKRAQAESTHRERRLASILRKSGYKVIAPKK